MPAQWTADVIGELHVHGLHKKDLAAQMGLHPKYVSVILNGHKAPKNAEAKFRTALAELVANKVGTESTAADTGTTP